MVVSLMLAAEVFLLYYTLRDREKETECWDEIDWAVISAVLAVWLIVFVICVRKMKRYRVKETVKTQDTKQILPSDIQLEKLQSIKDMYDDFQAEPLLTPSME